MQRLTGSSIEEAERLLLEAIKTSDVNTLERMLHDDLLFIAPNGQTVTKEMDLASHRAGTMVVEEVIPTIEAIHLIDDTAVCIVVYQTRGRMMGAPVAGRFRYIRVWKIFNDGLKVIGGSCIQLSSE